MNDDVLAGVFTDVMPGPIATAAFSVAARSESICESLMPVMPEMSHRTFMGGYSLPVPYVNPTTSLRPYVMATTEFWRGR